MDHPMDSFPIVTLVVALITSPLETPEQQKSLVSEIEISEIHD
jgi:hypothetical protein